MIFKRILREKSFLVYGLGSTGKSAVNFLKKSKAKRIFLWDDNIRLRKKFKIKDKEISLKKKIIETDYILLSPGISLLNCRYKKLLTNFKKKIITDIDLFF